jgi:hypothetical protein
VILITSIFFVGWDTLVVLKKLGAMQRLEELRAQLRHFEQSPDFGDGDAVERIRQHLLLRIREAEATMQTQQRMHPRGKAA